MCIEGWRSLNNRCNGDVGPDKRDANLTRQRARNAPLQGGEVCFKGQKAFVFLEITSACSKKPIRQVL